MKEPAVIFEPAAAPSAGVESEAAASRAPTEARAFVRAALVFVLIGMALYAGIYAASEQLIHRYARRNRFYVVKTAPARQYDFVILGASHAAALGYDDLTSRLEEMTASRVLNLAIAGAGTAVNRLVLEYFLAHHSTPNVVYVVDSFAFYSRQWNQERLQDVRLFHRAPFDPALARLLLRRPATRRMALDYLLGFSRINNADRFKPDMDDAEAAGRFEKTYRPIKQIDQQRLDYLYPQTADAASQLAHYLAEFEDLIRYATSRNIHFIVIKPPIPERIYRALPNEARFDAALKPMLAREGVEFHDFSLVGNDQRFFFDSDHLNRAGVMNFFENYLKGLLSAPGPATPDF